MTTTHFPIKKLLAGIYPKMPKTAKFFSSRHAIRTVPIPQSHGQAAYPAAHPRQRQCHGRVSCVVRKAVAISSLRRARVLLES
ncbi:hypothetical protein HJFPF1_11583 [Paramyrothecium foliicola]|nr:hypothetical protein HJFPF1_11583 [Paramyrothecium foliicola]